MRNCLKNTIFLFALAAVLYLTGIGLKETLMRLQDIPTSESLRPEVWNLKSEAFLSGPLAADVGELCVFRLSDPGTKADWIIVRQSDFGPPATCYIDSSGSSLAFASNIPSKYTIVAAIVEEGLPKILTHICEYGLSPGPKPSPNPSPTPGPTPQPLSLGEWVKQNIPEAGRSQCAALASCYESAAEGIEKGSIKSQEAAFSAILTATQTKIKPEIWEKFLDQLTVKITEKLNGSNDVKKTSAIFSEIAEVLKAVSEEQMSFSGSKAFSEALKIPSAIPAADSISTPGICTDPTGKTCPQSQPTIQPRRSK